MMNNRIRNKEVVDMYEIVTFFRKHFLDHVLMNIQMSELVYVIASQFVIYISDYT